MPRPSGLMQGARLSALGSRTVGNSTAAYESFQNADSLDSRCCNSIVGIPFQSPLGISPRYKISMYSKTLAVENMFAP